MIKPIPFHGPIRSLTSLGMRTALIVDDVPAMRAIVDRAVRQLDVATIQARNGKEAFKQLQHQRVDVVITDVEMPLWSGFDLLQAIRHSQDRRIRVLPVIVVSSLDERTTAARTKQFAGTHFLSKPISISRLRVTLKRIATRCWTHQRSVR
ncbi:response regulator [Stieleria maiorica]|uniref:response regulator n=1 Tax=Stieleria maiorica TaxID=2795974 RepID=UPI0011CBECCD|nr:response regulator [Stieleria maiorica]